MPINNLQLGDCTKHDTFTETRLDLADVSPKEESSSVLKTIGIFVPTVITFFIGAADLPRDFDSYLTRYPGPRSIPLLVELYAPEKFWERLMTVSIDNGRVPLAIEFVTTDDIVRRLQFARFKIRIFVGLNNTLGRGIFLPDSLTTPSLKNIEK